jgi:TRAP-type uncharacterized transport system substrate-binding protein
MIAAAARRTRAAALLPIAGLLAAALASRPSLRASETFVSIGTGETDGVCYPVVQVVCRIAGPELRTQGILRSPEATPGSVYNVTLHPGAARVYEELGLTTLAK